MKIVLEELEEKENVKNKWVSTLKITAGIFLVVFLMFASYFVYFLAKRDLFGWRLNFNLSKIETNNYEGIAPTIAFRYPKIFELDIDRDGKYGKDYIVGMKLKTDERTGCDIRKNGPQLDLSKTNQELLNETINQIKEKASNFQLLESGKTSILDGRDAFHVSFSFLDPIGARVRLDQLFIPEEERYMIICGTGEYQYDFFEKDFQFFYNSINFDGRILDNRTWWQKLMFWK